MSILDGFVRTKRYRKTDSGYVWQSEDTHESSVKFTDGTTLTEKIVSHPQSASDITEGVFSGQVSSPAGTDYMASRMRNVAFLSVDDDPGEGTQATHANGSIVCVYEIK